MPKSSEQNQTNQPHPERVKAWRQLNRFHSRINRSGAHFIFGRIGWNSRGVLKTRVCSTSPYDFIQLGDCERPNTRYGWARYHVLHGLLMSFPSKDIAWFTKHNVKDLSNEDVDDLEREFKKVIKQLRNLND